MSLSKQQLMTGLVALSPDELREVQGRASALLGSKAAQAAPAASDADEQLVYAELCEALRRHVGRAPPFGMFRSRHACYPRFREAVGVLNEFVTEHLRPRGRAERVKAVRTLLGLVVRSRVARHRAYVGGAARRPVRPVSVYSAVEDCWRIGEVVEDAFPGYLEAGVLPVILKAQTQGRGA